MFGKRQDKGFGRDQPLDAKGRWINLRSIGPD